MGTNSPRYRFTMSGGHEVYYHGAWRRVLDCNRVFFDQATPADGTPGDFWLLPGDGTSLLKYWDGVWDFVSAEGLDEVVEIRSFDDSVHSVFVTKDSGERQEYASGMVRDLQDGKPAFHLLMPEGIPYEAQPLTRFAALLERGQAKYGPRNWERAGSQEELERFKASAFRHFMQWFTDEGDEDHMAAVMFNLMAYEATRYKIVANSVHSPWTDSPPGTRLSDATGQEYERNEEGSWRPVETEQEALF